MVFYELLITSNALGQDVEGASQKYVVSGIANNMNSEVKGNITDAERDVMSESQRRANRAVGGLHAKNNTGGRRRARMRDEWLLTLL